MNPFLEPTAEFFERASVPPQIQELLDEWPEIDPGTARLIRAAVMSREPRQLRQAGEMLNAQAELARAMQSNGSPALLTDQFRPDPDGGAGGADAPRCLTGL